jgi:anti-anti-sigma factor
MHPATAERGVRQLARIVPAAHGDDIVVARIEGEVDMSNAHLVGNRLRDLLTNRSVAIIVDLGPTTYLDSSGIALLFTLVDELRRRQQQLHLVVPEASHLTRALTITGVDRAVPTHATLDEALADAR